MNNSETLPIYKDKFIRIMSSCCFGWHLQSLGISSWDKGTITDFKGDILDDGSLLISNRYENDEIYFYYLSTDGEFSHVSMNDLDNDNCFQAFVLSTLDA